MGLLGGGQLARMIVLEGHRLGLEMHVYSENRMDPAALVSAFHHPGKMSDSAALEKFLHAVDVATFESEFVDGKQLKYLADKTVTPIRPDPLLMDSLQDRAEQKQLLVRYKIPTADFLPVNSPDDFARAQAYFKNEFVLKKRRFGYDGYGTFYSSKKQPLAYTPDQYGYIAEAKISFKRELATQLFRNAKGQIQVFPLVQTHQENSRCLWVKGPVRHPQLKALTAKLKNFMSKLNIEGTVAFELFDTGAKLLVNEIAPRVHNSGHYSLNALKCNQFEMHLRSLLQHSLPTPQLVAPGFAMWNLLGTGAGKMQLATHEDAHLHWYGKTKNTAGRKMGHLNVTAKSADLALKTARARRKDFSI